MLALLRIQMKNLESPIL